MKKIIFLTILIISFFNANSLAQEKLSCSSKGTTLFYINGMFNGRTGSENITEQIDLLFSKNLQNQRLVDSNGIVEADHVYSRSFARMNDGLKDIVFGGLSDLWEVAGQKIEDRVIKDGVNSDSTYLWIAWSLWSDESEALSLENPITVTANKTIQNAFYVINQMIPGSEPSSSDEDLSQMVTKTGDALKAGKKVIVVSHSQGNFFANDLYEELFFNQADEYLKYEKVWGNLQIASPSNYIASGERGELIKLSEDFLSGERFLFPVLIGQEANYTLEGDTYKDIDYLAHSMKDIYLSDKLRASIKSGNVFKTMEDIFLEKLNLVASKLDPNCCLGADGKPTDEILSRHINQTPFFDDEGKLAFRKKVGGLVSNKSTVDEYAIIDEGAFVCGTSTISKLAHLFSGTEIINSNIESAIADMSIENIYTKSHYDIDDTFLGVRVNYRLDIQSSKIKDSTIKGIALIAKADINNSTLDSLNHLDTLSFEEGIVLPFPHNTIQLRNTYVVGKVKIENSDIRSPLEVQFVQDDSQVLIKNSIFIGANAEAPQLQVSLSGNSSAIDSQLEIVGAGRGTGLINTHLRGVRVRDSIFSRAQNNDESRQKYILAINGAGKSKVFIDHSFINVYHQADSFATLQKNINFSDSTIIKNTIIRPSEKSQILFSNGFHAEGLKINHLVEKISLGVNVSIICGEETASGKNGFLGGVINIGNGTNIFCSDIRNSFIGADLLISNSSIDDAFIIEDKIKKVCDGKNDSDPEDPCQRTPEEI